MALQEAQIALACIIQKFDFSFADPDYELQIKSALTVKPGHLYIHAVPRPDRVNVRYTSGSAAPSRTSSPTKGPKIGSTVGSEGGHPLQVLYGSNTGTSESFAQRIAADAAHFGFSAKLGTLDSAANRLASDRPVIIVTASFEGQPADNAASFVEWIEKLEGSQFPNLQYAVFGCGNREWTQTFQRIPKLLDSKLAELGAQSIVERGEGDASGADFFETFDKWEANLFEALSKVSVL